MLLEEGKQMNFLYPCIRQPVLTISSYIPVICYLRVSRSPQVFKSFFSKLDILIQKSVMIGEEISCNAQYALVWISAWRRHFTSLLYTSIILYDNEIAFIVHFMGNVYQKLLVVAASSNLRPGISLSRPYFTRWVICSILYSI